MNWIRNVLLYYMVLNWIVSHCSLSMMLCWIELYCIGFYWIELYCIGFYCIGLYCIGSCLTKFDYTVFSFPYLAVLCDILPYSYQRSFQSHKLVTFVVFRSQRVQFEKVICNQPLTVTLWVLSYNSNDKDRKACHL